MKKNKNKLLALGLAAALTLPVLSATDVQAASWQKNNTGWWWLEDDNSYPVSEWKSIYGKWYYFDSNGYMLDEGWHWIGRKCYYMYSGGAMASNTWIGDSYVDASGAWLPNAKPAQWMKSNNRWWYRHADGSYPANTWETINGSWYYFDKDGWMLDKGWHWINGKCYYMYSGGAMASNTWIGDSYVDGSGAWVQNQWESSGNRWWYRYADGSYPASTWKYIDGSWYYFDKNGWMLDKGWHWINGNCYYMYSGGAMASDAWIEQYYVDASGAWVKNIIGYYKDVLVEEEWTEKIEHPEEGHYETQKVPAWDETVHHEEEGHYETQKVLVKEAWDEKVRNPGKDVWDVHYICNGCKKDFGKDYDAVSNHVYEEILNGNLACGGFHQENILIEEGYDIIHHEAVYEDKEVWVVDKEAWDEVIHHPETEEEVWVVDKEAWVEEIFHEAVYEKQWVVETLY